MAKNYDVSPDILKWYKNIYSGEEGLGCYFDLEKPCNEEERAYYKAKGSDIQIDVSGDIVFNFSKSGAKGQSRYDTIGKYITDILDDDLKAVYMDRLDVCGRNHESKENCSLIPKQGNLQKAKQGIGNDRGDTFIWALDEYFENGCKGTGYLRNRDTAGQAGETVENQRRGTGNGWK